MRVEAYARDKMYPCAGRSILRPDQNYGTNIQANQIPETMRMTTIEVQSHSLDETTQNIGGWYL